MDDKLEALEQSVGGRRNFDTPPLHLWHPPLSGDMPVLIKANGDWYHDDGLIKREALVRLFASILRREEDGEYYLVTPAEKWRIKVELLPLMVTDVERNIEAGEPCLVATLNVGRRITVSEKYPLFLEHAADDVAAIRLDHGLSALFTRAAWYRLVEMAEEGSVRSGGIEFSLLPG